ncbi:hypothetical protein EYF80_050940 [Liparis tanakae]|uniref:Uncharacterized protein n=1 Tax=Liparis tanakae TaxID=230148 RepID=A0A4Z2FEP7_9TELE|nr:hypothetical protein EYF80_050940 [Liparis tanakae]
MTPSSARATLWEGGHRHRQNITSQFISTDLPLLFLLLPFSSSSSSPSDVLRKSKLHRAVSTDTSPLSGRVLPSGGGCVFICDGVLESTALVLGGEGGGTAPDASSCFPCRSSTSSGVTSPAGDVSEFEAPPLGGVLPGSSISMSLTDSPEAEDIASPESADLSVTTTPSALFSLMWLRERE